MLTVTTSVNSWLPKIDWRTQMHFIVDFCSSSLSFRFTKIEATQKQNFAMKCNEQDARFANFGEIINYMFLFMHKMTGQFLMFCWFHIQLHDLSLPVPLFSHNCHYNNVSSWSFSFESLLLMRYAFNTNYQPTLYSIPFVQR